MSTSEHRPPSPRARPSLPGSIATGRTRGEVVEPGHLHRRAAELLDQGFRLALVAAHHDTAAAIRVVYLFVKGPPDTRVELHVHLDPDTPAVPTLAGLSFPASRFEREMRDMYGVVPLKHPLPRRLVRHPHWPRGWYPMRADAGPAPEFGDPDTPFPFRPVEGAGTYEIPVGPVHAGLIEPGHFRFTVVGETILKLKARLWFTHKGIESLFEGDEPSDRLPLAERVSGDTAVGHALAYCLAVEEAAGIDVHPGAAKARALLLEMERVHNHVTDLGALCNDVGHSVLHADALRIREDLLRLNHEVTGHRLLRGGVTLGGATLRRIPDLDRVAAAGDDIRELAALANAHTIIRDRFAGTAVLSRRDARQIGTLGYVARASGLDRDARVNHPFVDLGDTLTVPTRTSGDVLARFRVRADEIDVSIELITALARDLGSGPSLTWRPSRPPTGAGAGSPEGPVGPVDTFGPAGSAGTGIVEGWRGTITHRVELDSGGRLRRVKIADPSFFNWPALPVALRDTIVPDFPLTNKSFNLSYAGNDL